MIESADTRTLDSEAKAVVAWRRQQLSAAGFDTPTAEALAQNPSVDLHALLELVDRGCPPGSLRAFWRRSRNEPRSRE